MRRQRSCRECCRRPAGPCAPTNGRTWPGHGQPGRRPAPGVPAAQASTSARPSWAPRPSAWRHGCAWASPRRQPRQAAASTGAASSAAFGFAARGLRAGFGFASASAAAAETSVEDSCRCLCRRSGDVGRGFLDRGVRCSSLGRGILDRRRLRCQSPARNPRPRSQISSVLVQLIASYRYLHGRDTAAWARTRPACDRPSTRR